MRVADYIAETVAGLGVHHVFVVTGGGAMHLNDALARRRDLEPIFCHHEQACAIAAEGYARMTGRPGVICVTTGPGGTNATTGVLGQWHDSVPALYVSGQVRRDTTVASTRLPLRQLGDQEADIIRLVAPITKYAVSVTDPASVRYHLEKAVWLATHGRPGPVWVDVPLDVQATQVEPDSLKGFDPNRPDGFDPSEVDDAEKRLGEAPAVAGAASAAAERRRESSLSPWPPVRPATQSAGAFSGRFDHAVARAAARETARRLASAARPVLLVGSAVRSAGHLELFLDVAGQLGVPVCTAWNACDVLWEDHPLFAGRPGTVGDRAGNFALQNADVAVVLGCRLNVRQVGYEFRAFAHHAYRIVVDIDEAELAKPTIFPDLAVHADVGFFLRELAQATGAGDRGRHAAWVARCNQLRRRYPVVDPAYRAVDEPVNPYVFVERLSSHLADGDAVVCANGSACVVTLQALACRPLQRLLVNSGTAGMGWDLPAAVGAAFARRAATNGGAASRGEAADAASNGDAALLEGSASRVICLAGDGSIQMNIHELQTVVHHRLPIKIFVFDNAGYASIRQTQDNLFDGRRVGEGPGSGLTLPDLVAVARAYGMPATRVTRHAALDEAIGVALANDGPFLVDVVMNPEQPFAPKVIAERLPDGRLISKPLEDMYPFLSREEFAGNMLGPTYAPEER